MSEQGSNTKNDIEELQVTQYNAAGANNSLVSHDPNTVIGVICSNSSAEYPKPTVCLPNQQSLRSYLCISYMLNKGNMKNTTEQTQRSTGSMDNTGKSRLNAIVLFDPDEGRDLEQWRQPRDTENAHDEKYRYYLGGHCIAEETSFNCKILFWGFEGESVVSKLLHDRLYQACFKGEYSEAKKLLHTKGADANYRYECNSLLCAAVESCDEVAGKSYAECKRLVELLVKNGAGVSQIIEWSLNGNYGKKAWKSILHYKTLIQLSILLTIKDNDNDKDKERVRDYWPNPSIKNSDGKTALEYVQDPIRSSGYPGVAKLLTDYEKEYKEHLLRQECYKAAYTAMKTLMETIWSVGSKSSKDSKSSKEYIHFNNTPIPTIVAKCLLFDKADVDNFSGLPKQYKASANTKPSRSRPTI